MTNSVIATFSCDNNSDGRIQVNVQNSGSSTNSSHFKDVRIFTFLRNHAALLSVCALISIIVLLLVAIILLIKRDQVPVTAETEITFENQKPSLQDASTDSPPLDLSSNLTLPPKFTLVSRDEWSAQEPIKPPTPLQNPVPYVLILHTGTENCYTPTQCVLNIRFIQVFQMENYNWNDIGYNFLSGGDGRAYEGRGWKAEGPQTYGYHDESIRIAFVGTFNTSKPSVRQITACKNLIKEGVEMGYIKKKYKLLAAAHLRKMPIVQNRDETLFEDITTWENFIAQEEHRI